MGDPLPAVELHLLGRFVVVREGAEIAPAAFGGRKVRALVRVLATRRGGFVPHDWLADALWGQRLPADPVANLQVLVNRIRRALADPHFVVTGSGGYALTDDERVRIDLECLLAELRSAATLDDLTRVLATYRGEPLAEDRDEPWAADLRAEVERARRDGYERAAVLALAAGEPARAADLAAQSLAVDALREPGVLLLVRALAASGDRAGALRSYERYRRSLADELGVDPSAEAQALYADLLRDTSATAPVAAMRPPPELRRPRFVGRATERAAVAEAVSSGRRVVAVTGVSGAGKSRLMHEVDLGRQVLRVRASWAERSDAWSLARALVAEILSDDIQHIDSVPPSARAALAEVAPDVPPPPEQVSVDPESRRALAIEAVVRLTRTLGDAVVLIDDAQWADPTSLDVLASIADKAQNVCVLLAYRSEETPARLADVVQRADAPVVELGPLTAADLADLVDDAALADALLETTDRTPLAVTEVLHALQHERLATPDPGGRWRCESPDAAARAAELASLGQRRMIVRRADAQPADSRLVLDLVALLARPCAAETLAAASGLEEPAVLQLLGGLASAGLVRLDDAGWRAAHDMVAEAVAAAVDPRVRPSLHAGLARALAQQDEDVGEIARHWLRAGERHRAVQAFSAAAEAALQSFANAEAASLASAGLDAGPARGDAAALMDVRGRARRRLGDIAGARSDLRAAAAQYGRGVHRAGVLTELASLASGADDLVRASEVAELALVEAGPNPSARAPALHVASVIDMNLGRAERAKQRADEALNLFGTLGDSQGAARILDARAMATFLDGDIASGAALLKRAADLFDDSGDLMHAVTPRSTHGHALVLRGQPDAGLEAVSGALETARALGYPEGEAYALWHAAEALAALGKDDEARAAADRALEIATGLGHRGWIVTAWRAVGIAAVARDDLDAALAAFRRSLDGAANLDLFAAWAAARCALVLVRLRRYEEAESLVARALGHGPALGQYEARLADVELATARGEANASTRAQDALDRARRGGYQLHVARLAEIAAGDPSR